MTILTAFVFFLSLNLSARPAYYGMLLANYPGSRIEQGAKCMACHNGRAVNSYGKAFVNEYSKLSKPEIFKKIGLLDSDNDGLTNDQEIMEGRNPGVANK